jgi:hypothetical protein
MAKSVHALLERLMNHRFKLLTTRCLAAALLFTTSALAMAQYIWIDDKGVKQLSDRPPPPSVPEKRILKAPGKPLFNPYAPAEQEPSAASAAPAAEAAKPLTLAERNADFNKRKTEAAEAAKTAAAEAQRKSESAANCDAARKNQQALDNGMRVRAYDQNGEPAYMNDLQREDLRKNTQKVLAECK